MKPWNELSETGRFRRLRALAAAALDHYEVQPTRLQLVGGFTNAIFRVDTAAGKFALRVDYHGDHSDRDVDNELAWLAALAADTDLDVCRLVLARDGSPYVYAAAAGVPSARRCVLFEWIPGRPLDDTMTESGYYKLGRLSAGLHRHGRKFEPPHPPLRWDRVFYWPEEVDPVVVFDPKMDRFINTDRRRILDQSLAVVATAFAKLSPDDAQVIHGDLHPSNVHTYRKRLIAFDFEDITMGHRVQDVAITLFYQRDHPGYADLREAFTEGYRTMAPWPVTYAGELEHFMAARSLSFVNYVANLREDPSDYYEVVFPRLQRFLNNWA
ncbi:MAG: phosphotransferase [Acidimicrobiia bacterium]|nr:phosphotransferase [Acidimicrobiia bacterium]